LGVLLPKGTGADIQYAPLPMPGVVVVIRNCSYAQSGQLWLTGLWLVLWVRCRYSNCQ